jgi:primary-amine oxidase
MLPLRYATCLLIGGALALMAVTGDAGNPGQPPQKSEPGQPPQKGGPGQVPAPQKVANEIIQEFPTNSNMETAWKVRYGTVRGYGVYITGAWFKRSPKDRWLQILGDARLSEMFVPYHSSSPRFWDISYNFDLCTVTKDDAGPFGKLLPTAPGGRYTLVQEIRDRGVIYKDHKHTRRGQALVLWGCLEAANYRYIIEYGFQDDGAVTFRVGSTGRNYGGREYEGHMHNGLWRVNVALDGPENNSVYAVEHIEPLPDLGQQKRKLMAKSLVTPFNGGKEGWMDWTAEKFTMLRVTNDRIKGKQKGDALSYDLMPLRMGSARHHGGGWEVATLHDFWVTKNRPGEIAYTRLPKYVEKGNSIMNTDVVLWHSTPAHHEPRMEDGKMEKGLQGATHVMWAGFMLRPRNLFEHTPLYPYGK